MSHPYGNALDGSMLGTIAFPALYLEKEFVGSHLPVQNDANNCGIGICTCIAIVLRDVVIQDIPNEEPLITFDELFNVTNLELREYDDVNSPNKNEHYCDFAGQELLAQPLRWKSTKENDYLTKVHCSLNR